MHQLLPMAWPVGVSWRLELVPEQQAALALDGASLRDPQLPLIQPWAAHLVWEPSSLLHQGPAQELES